MRIASLLASGTEIAWALGLGDEIVAISHECDFPPELLDRPRVTRPRFEPDGLDSGQLDAAVRESMEAYGSVYEIDRDAVREARPDLMLTQAVCEVCAVPANDARTVAGELANGPRVVSLDAHTIDEILGTIREVGDAAGARNEADRYIGRLRERIDRVRGRVADAPKRRVLALEWLDPPFVPGHWVPEMIEIAGGANLAGSVGERSRQAVWEELEGLHPDALIVMPCGYKLEASRKDADRHADRLARLAPRAVEQGAAFVVDASSYFNRSGPRVVDGVEILAALLHPDCFPDTDLDGRAERWTPPGRSG